MATFAPYEVTEAAGTHVAGQRVVPGHVLWLTPAQAQYELIRGTIIRVSTGQTPNEGIGGFRGLNDVDLEGILDADLIQYDAATGKLRPASQITEAVRPTMASASRSGVNVDVTITHGLGTDYTLPANARRVFWLLRADGRTVPITSVSRQSATVLRCVAAFAPNLGTASGATSNAAGYVVGETVITLASAGTGAFVKGDLVLVAGDDPVPYEVAVGDADVSNGGSITLVEPGLRKAIPASATGITLAPSTLVCYDRKAFNQENGIGFADAADLPYDNSDAAARLRAGVVTVA